MARQRLECVRFIAAFAPSTERVDRRVSGQNALKSADKSDALERFATTNAIRTVGGYGSGLYATWAAEENQHCNCRRRQASSGHGSGRSVARLARLFRVQEVVSSNLTAPTILPTA